MSPFRSSTAPFASRTCRRLAAWLGLAVLPGCGAILGPLVVDVYPDDNGDVVVERCYFEVTTWGSLTRYELSECSKKKIVFEDSYVPTQPKRKTTKPAKPAPSPADPPKTIPPIDLSPESPSPDEPETPSPEVP